MKQTSKRAQLSIFVILGLVIIIVVLFLWYLNSIKPEQISFEKISENPVRTYVESCLDVTTRRALTNLGLRGGYIYLPQGIIEFEGLKPIVYLYYYGQYPAYISPTESGFYRLASLSSWERDIERYLSEEFPKCINAFEPLKEMGYYIDFKTPKPQVFIRETDVLVKLYYPLKIEKDEKIVNLEEFQITIPLNLKDVHDEAERALNAIYFADESEDKELTRSMGPRLAIYP
ncbi:MAG: hypothetical protein QXU20_04460, partial [Candidatus Woesearchaeota archaeon]